MEKFTHEVCEKIGYYVYRLVDPRNGQTFYVGKGKGNLEIPYSVLEGLKARHREIFEK